MNLLNSKKKMKILHFRERTRRNGFFLNVRIFFLTFFLLKGKINKNSFNNGISVVLYEAKESHSNKTPR